MLAIFRDDRQYLAQYEYRRHLHERLYQFQTELFSIWIGEPNHTRDGNERAERYDYEVRQQLSKEAFHVRRSHTP